MSTHNKYQIKLGEMLETREPVYLDLRKFIETRGLIEASSGGGKSTLMRLIAERAAGVVQTIILDHEDEFPTLRPLLDVLLVGDDRDIPISVESAPLLARRLAETRISAVINLFDLPINERREYVGAFLTELLSLKKHLWHPMFIMLDEAHIYAPEKGDAPSRAPVVNMMSQGRKREFCEIVATQRFSKIDKDAIADAKNVFIGGTFLDVDQKRAGDMLGIKPADYPTLRDMGTGEWFAFGQAIVSRQRGVIRFQADKPQTEKPKSGTQHFIVPKASDVIESLVAQLGDLPAQAEEEGRTLEHLQIENTRMKRELAARPVQYQTSEPTIQIQYVDKPVLNGEVGMFRDAAAALGESLAPLAHLNEMLSPLQRLPELVTPIHTALAAIMTKVELVERAQANPPTPQQEFVRMPAQRPAYNTAPRVAAPVVSADGEPITPYIVDLLKTFARRHPLPLTKSQLALLAGKGKKSSMLDSALAKIKRLGLVTNSAEMELTSAGFAALGSDVPLPPQIFDEICALWRDVLNEYERALFDELHKSYTAGNDAGLTTDELSQRSGKSKTSSQFQSTVAMFVKNKIAVRHGERLALFNPLTHR